MESRVLNLANVRAPVAVLALAMTFAVSGCNGDDKAIDTNGSAWTDPLAGYPGSVARHMDQGWRLTVVSADHADASGQLSR